MSEQQYRLTPVQVTALRALAGGIVELSPTEVAVSGLLMPDDVRNALTDLERLGLVNSWIPATGATGESVYALTDEGQTVYRALDQFRGIPPAGSVVRIPRGFATWFSRQTPSYVEVVPENQHVTTE